MKTFKKNLEDNLKDKEFKKEFNKIKKCKHKNTIQYEAGGLLTEECNTCGRVIYSKPLFPD